MDARNHSSLGTVIHIGEDWRNPSASSVKADYLNMPVQSASYRSSERSKTTDSWTTDGGYGSNGGYTVQSPPQSRPATRYSDRAASAGSNVSLKDNVDVYVEDKFHKSYNLNYEPVRIRIGDDDGGNGGSVYQSRPFANTTNYGSDWNRQGNISSYASES